MTHWPLLPILIPLVAAIALLLLAGAGLRTRRLISLFSVLALAGVAGVLVVAAGSGSVEVYRLGNWPAPYGIVLVVDRLSAMLVALTAAISLPVVLAAMSDADTRGQHFHALLQFQIAGINGAFLTGDLFNMFVFFEILLLASYILLVHGGGSERVRVGLAYVILNLTGSALFLVALGLLYGTLGTLNLADAAQVLPTVPPENQALVRTGATLLVVVFLLKAALFPLGLWLPHVYAAASMPVACLFAIMTKVGIYCVLRVSSIGFAAAPFTADILQTWLPWLAISTIAIGAIGVLAADRLSVAIGNLVVLSTGTLLAAIAAGKVDATSAALYYLPHSTLVTGGLFLFADYIMGQRGADVDIIKKGPRLRNVTVAGGAFLILAMAISGAPPLSGFIGKLMLMQAVMNTSLGPAFWSVLLLSGLIVTLALARVASAFFWEPGRTLPVATLHHGSPAKGSTLALALLVIASPLLSGAASSLTSWTQATANQLHAREPYITAILGALPRVEREQRP